jgi:hypothetical protein
MPPILPSETWSVRFRVGELYLIYSEEYQNRLCIERARRPGAAFRSRGAECLVSLYFAHIWIASDGTIAGGWKQIKNPEQILLKDDRREIMDADRRFDADWGPQPFFQAIPSG